MIWLPGVAGSATPRSPLNVVAADGGSATADLSLLLPLLTTVVVAVAGWLVVNHLSARREQTNKRREITVSYLIDAYRALDDNTSRLITPARARALERAVSDIQLFGTPRQVLLAHGLVASVGETRGGSAGASMDELMEDLRASLRSELDLPAADRSRTQWRISLAFDQEDEIDPGRRRELIWEALAEAYRTLEGVSDGFTGEARELDRALCDVTVFGGPWQAEIAERLRNQLDSGSSLDGEALLALASNLRDSLRADLSLRSALESDVPLSTPARRGDDAAEGGDARSG